MDKEDGNGAYPTGWEKPFGLGMLLGFAPLAALFALALINQETGLLRVQFAKAAGLLTLVVFFVTLAASAACIVRRSTRTLGLGIGTGTMMAFGLGEAIAFLLTFGGGGFLT